jgi:hypothetical protein
MHRHEGPAVREGDDRARAPVLVVDFLSKPHAANILHRKGQRIPRRGQMREGQLMAFWPPTPARTRGQAAV